MIISERQIIQLLIIANNFMSAPLSNDFDACKKQVATLLDQINNQQSDELKEIK